MRLDELPRSDRIDDRRGSGAGISIGRAGGLGIGTIIILGLVGWALGINPLLLIGGAEILSGTGGTQQEQPAPSDAQAGSPDQMREFVSAVLGSTEVQWKEIFAAAGKTYAAPTLVMFSGGTRSGQPGFDLVAESRKSLSARRHRSRRASGRARRPLPS